MANYSKLAVSIRSGIRAMVRKNYPGVELKITINDYETFEVIDLWVKRAPFALTREGVNGDAGDYFDLMSEKAKEMIKRMIDYVIRRSNGNPAIGADWYVGCCRLDWR